MLIYILGLISGIVIVSIYRDVKRVREIRKRLKDLKKQNPEW